MEDYQVEDYCVNGKARCPQCGTTVQFAKGCVQTLEMGLYRTDYKIRWVECPSCGNLIITLIHQELGGFPEERTIYPLSTQRESVPAEVPPAIRSDYEEAALVLPLSVKGSAALSRRCLQAVLEDAGHATKRNLKDEIDEVISQMPTYLGNMLQQVRVIGNFSAHPIKDTATGTILDVETGEAEWNLDVLDELFDFFYTRPTIAQQKTERLNQKLTAAGKPTI